MRSLSLNLLSGIGKVFYSQEEKTKEDKKSVNKERGMNAPKLYNDAYEKLTLEQQLIINQMCLTI